MSVTHARRHARPHAASRHWCSSTYRLPAPLLNCTCYGVLCFVLHDLVVSELLYTCSVVLAMPVPIPSGRRRRHQIPLEISRCQRHCSCSPPSLEHPPSIDTSVLLLRLEVALALNSHTPSQHQAREAPNLRGLTSWSPSNHKLDMLLWNRLIPLPPARFHLH